MVNIKNIFMKIFKKSALNIIFGLNKFNLASKLILGS